MKKNFEYRQNLKKKLCFADISGTSWLNHKEFNFGLRVYRTDKCAHSALVLGTRNAVMNETVLRGMRIIKNYIMKSILGYHDDIPVF